MFHQRPTNSQATTGGRSQITAMLLTAALLLSGPGCASLQVPRIDPSGDRIFLPQNAPASPSGPADWLRHCDLSGWRPAFKRPDSPLPESLLNGPVNGAPCGSPPQQGPCGPNTPPPTGCFGAAKSGKGWGTALTDSVKHQLHRFHCEPVAPRGVPGTVCLSPQALVAPVGREVMLVAGMCGDDGYLRVDQPMEWMLSQESVGHFVDVSEPAPHWGKKVSCREGYKQGINYALTTTTDKQQMITRGTPSTKDDLLLQRGQTWVSLTSPSEGTSYVTTLASDGDRWDQRRKTATIHWVDADIAFPVSAQLQRGDRGQLVTTVVRASDRLPAEGYIVRYTVQDSVSARFVESGSATLETTTNGNGEAVATIEQTEGSVAPAVPVQIEVIRPVRGASPRLPIAQSTINLVWASAQLQVTCAPGQSVVAEGAVATYQFTVSNPGNMPARNVRATVRIPDAFDFQNSTPAPNSAFGENRGYEIGELPAGGSWTVTVNLLAKPGVGGSVRLVAAAEGEPNLSAQSLACATEIVRPALQVTLTPTSDGPVEVGQPASYQVLVTNIGQQPLDNVTVIAEFPPQLQERYGNASPIQRLVSSDGRLAAGAAASPFFVTYLPLTPGQHTHRVTVTASGGHVASQMQTLQAIPAAQRQPEAKLEIRKEGPAQVSVNQEADYSIYVANTGDVAINNVQIADRYPQSMTPLHATRGWTALAGELRWTLPKLEPGQNVRLQVKCRADRPDPQANNQAVVFGEAEGTGARVQESFDLNTEIVGGAAAPAPAPPIGAAPTGPGGPAAPAPAPGVAAGAANEPLSISVSALADPVRVGERVEYVAVIGNRLPQPDRNVMLTIRVPEGMAAPMLRGPTEARSLGNGVFAFRPIEELRANESLQNQPFQFSFAPQQPGIYTIRVEITSANSPQPIVREIRSTVQP